MGLKPSDIRFEAVKFVEDRAQYAEPQVLWIDLVWNDFRLELGHTMDDNEWSLLYRGKHVMFVRDMDQAKAEILLLIGS